MYVEYSGSWQQIYIHTCRQAYIHAEFYVFTHIHVHIHMYVHVSASVCVYAYLCVWVGGRRDGWRDGRKDACMCLCIYTHIFLVYT